MLSLCHACAEWFLGKSEVFVEYTCPDCLEKGHYKGPFNCAACQVARRVTPEGRKSVPF